MGFVHIRQRGGRSGALENARTVRRKKARPKDHTERAQVIEPSCPLLVSLVSYPYPAYSQETVHVPSPNTDVMCVHAQLDLCSCPRFGSDKNTVGVTLELLFIETARHGTARACNPSIRPITALMTVSSRKFATTI
jgi:hypothetical protein